MKDFLVISQISIEGSFRNLRFSYAQFLKLMVTYFNNKFLVEAR